jgi:CubicO group peptidase (beta-lactamase class C family)
VSTGVAPLCALGCAARLPPWHTETGGAREVFFDLASVTKPFTAVAVACSGMDRSAPLGALLEEARGTPSERVPLELFLAHRAGLDAHRALYAPLVGGEPVDIAAALREAASARRPEAAGDPPAEGFAPLYSDLGYLLAGEALARAVGARDAGDATARIVLEPLGLARSIGTVRELKNRDVSATFAPTEDVPWRGGTVVGAVHDENAWAITGFGGSGHAGLFGVVEGVLTFGQAVLDALDTRTGPLGGFDLDWIVRARNGAETGATLRAGFDGKSLQGSSAGKLMGSSSFGHLGFTGTSLWIDPDRKVLVSLLTNRVHPSRDSAAIKDARPWVHDALVELACSVARKD